MPDTTHARHARLWKRRPVIAVVAATPSRKQSGDGGTLVNAALLSLATLGYTECSAMITMGNGASERLFGRCGFVPKAD
jgi:L-amino acid N-acyltransferase YncA